MCRWFAYLGDEPQLLEDVLLNPTHSLVKQIDEHFLPSGHTSFDPSAGPPPLGSSRLSVASANDVGSPNPLTNMDGFGVCWWSDAYEEFTSGQRGSLALRPVMYKNVRPPLNDLVLRSLARGVSSTAVVAHIRAGTGLTPVVETNCHPFTFGRHVFCHNGVLGSFHLLKVRLLALLPMRYQVAILGTTDSEHIAALYFYHLCGADGDWATLYDTTRMVDAMRRTIARLEEIKAAAEEENGVETEHNALNLLVSSGSTMLGLRYASPMSREAPSLYYSTVAGADLNRKFEGDPDSETAGREGKQAGKQVGGHKPKDQVMRHAIIASEPTTYKAEDWRLLPSGSMLVVDQELDTKQEVL